MLGTVSSRTPGKTPHILSETLSHTGNFRDSPETSGPCLDFGITVVVLQTLGGQETGKQVCHRITGVQENWGPGCIYDIDRIVWAGGLFSPREK